MQIHHSDELRKKYFVSVTENTSVNRTLAMSLFHHATRLLADAGAGNGAGEAGGGGTHEDMFGSLSSIPLLNGLYSPSSILSLSFS